MKRDGLSCEMRKKESKPMKLSEVLSPDRLKGCSEEELQQLAEEMRQYIIDTVQKNGGHLASNLGVVELTLALHRVFDCPKDKILFDVGHQCYAHKLLTGRYDRFSALRQTDGLSGFPSRQESPCDVFAAMYLMLLPSLCNFNRNWSAPLVHLLLALGCFT